MQLLIITSEPLNPGNILPSTFELSQAQILSGQHDIAILSVQEHPAAYTRLKAVIKGLTRSRIGLKALSSAVTECVQIIQAFCKKKSGRVQQHIIEGVKVYEGHVFSVTHQHDFNKALQNWIEGGLLAFENYASGNGMPKLIHAHGRFLYAGALAREIQKKFGCPYIYTEHCTWYQSGIAPRAAIPVLRDVIFNAAAFTAVSPSLVKHVNKFIEQALPNAIVIPNVIDKIFQEPLCVKTRGEKFTFINIASLEAKKGIDVLLKAFARAFKEDKRYILKICGDGVLRSELEILCRDLGMEKQVFFLGQKSKQEIKSLLDQCDVFVLSSRIETFGVVIIEALARGLPIIATICGGPEYIVKPNCGLLIEADNIIALGNAMKQMCASHNHFDRTAIHNYATKEYGSDLFIQRMNNLYQSVTA